MVPQRPDVLKRVRIGQVEHQHVRISAAKSVEAIVSPFVVGVDGEVGYHGDVRDLQLVQVLVDDHGRVIRMLPVRRKVLLREVVPHELLLAENSHISDKFVISLKDEQGFEGLSGDRYLVQT